MTRRYCDSIGAAVARDVTAESVGSVIADVLACAVCCHCFSLVLALIIRFDVVADGSEPADLSVPFAPAMRSPS